MIISHKHKFIFIKTRKTAGSSIEKYLFDYLDPEDICTGSERDNTPSLNSPTNGGHVGYNWIIKRYPEEWKTYYKFSVERNPFDKAVSFFYWYQKIKPNRVKDGFEKFVLTSNYSSKKKKTRKSAFSDWELYTSSDTMFEVDKVIRYENLHTEFQNLPIPYNDELLTTYVKSGYRETKDYRKLHTKKTIAEIENQCYREIKHFGYLF